MEPIRVVWGTGAAPTAMASYDAALADAGLENYNLIEVSSVVPAGATVEAVGTAPNLGPAGERLTVVQGRATVPPGEEYPACAGLAWAVADDGPHDEASDGPGGSPRGQFLRDAHTRWEPTDPSVLTDGTAFEAACRAHFEETLGATYERGAAALGAD